MRISADQRSMAVQQLQRFSANRQSAVDLTRCAHLQDFHSRTWIREEDDCIHLHPRMRGTLSQMSVVESPGCGHEESESVSLRASASGNLHLHSLFTCNSSGKWANYPRRFRT